MLCPNCARENVPGASFCAACGAPLSASAAPPPPPPAGWAMKPQTSSMAIVSLVLGICGLFIPILAPLIGLVLGIVAVTQIGSSRGRLTGSGFAIAGICVSALTLLIVPAMLFPVFMRARETGRKISCLSNIKNLAIATNMYLADWDAFPDEHAWCDTLDEYVMNRGIYRCPSAPDLDCGFALNSALTLAPVSRVQDPARMVTIFESGEGWNASGGRGLLPSPPRHLGGDNYGFADGHGKWHQRGELSSLLQWTPEGEGGW